MGLFGNASPLVATWASKSGGLCKGQNCPIFHRGRALQILWHHIRCLQLLLKNTLERDPCGTVLACLCYDPVRDFWYSKCTLTWGAPGKNTSLKSMGHSSCTYPAPAQYSLCPALFIRVFFECKYYPVVVITQLVSPDKRLPQCQLVNIRAPLLPWVWTEALRRCKDSFLQLQILGHKLKVPSPPFPWHVNFSSLGIRAHCYCLASRRMGTSLVFVLLGKESLCESRGHMQRKY